MPRFPLFACFILTLVGCSNKSEEPANEKSSPSKLALAPQAPKLIFVPQADNGTSGNGQKSQPGNGTSGKTNRKTPSKPSKESSIDDFEAFSKELEKVGIAANQSGELTITEGAVDQNGDFKPGIPEMLRKLKFVESFSAVYLPKFSENAAKVIVSFGGIKKVELKNTEATPGAIAAFGNCFAIEDFDIYNNIENPAVDGKTLDALSKLKKLKRFECQSVNFNGSDLAVLANNPNLEILNLGGCNLDDAAAIHLSKLLKLKKLNISGSKISGGRFHFLSNLQLLEEIDLFQTQFTDEDIKFLANAKRLKSLGLQDTKITDRVTGEIVKLSTLETLRLGETKITDVSIERIASIPKLSKLTLLRLQLTDKSLRYLEKCPSLRELQFAKSQEFSEAALDKLREVNPELTISWY